MTQSDKKALEEFEKYMNEHKCFDSYAIETGKSFILKTRQEARDEERQRNEELAEALLMMYEQYCSDGHAFMSAGECASTVLEQQGYATFDEVGRMTHLTALTEQK